MVAAVFDRQEPIRPHSLVDRHSFPKRGQASSNLAGVARLWNAEGRQWIATAALPVSGWRSGAGRLGRLAKNGFDREGSIAEEGDDARDGERHPLVHRRRACPRAEAGKNEVSINAIENVSAILRAAGSSLDRVVQVTLLITDPADYAEINAEYVRHFPGGLPARHRPGDVPAEPAEDPAEDDARARNQRGLAGA